MLSEAYQRVATLQLGSNCCNFIAIFAALSSVALKSEQALTVNARASCAGGREFKSQRPAKSYTALQTVRYRFNI